MQMRKRCSSLSTYLLSSSLILHFSIFSSSRRKRIFRARVKKSISRLIWCLAEHNISTVIHIQKRISYKKIQFLFQDAGNGADPGLTSVCRSHHFRPSSTFLPILGGQSLESIPIVSRAGFGIAPFPLSLRTTFETQWPQFSSLYRHIRRERNAACVWIYLLCKDSQKPKNAARVCMTVTNESLIFHFLGRLGDFHHFRQISLESWKWLWNQNWLEREI